MTQYGIDIEGDFDITPGLHDTSSPMVGVCVRRLYTPVQGLLSAPDEDTIDITEYVSTGLTETELYQIRSDMSVALQADERIETVDISLQFDRVTEVMTANIKGNGAAGPFQLTLAVTSVSVEILTGEEL